MHQAVIIMALLIKFLQFSARIESELLQVGGSETVPHSNLLSALFFQTTNEEQFSFIIRETAN